MQKLNPEMIAEIIKNTRLAKGLTQKELAAQTNISVRSIQRIESAALLPRSYTLKTIAAVLDIPFSDLVISEEEAPGKKESSTTTVSPQKIILSFFIPILLLLAALAYISQSAKFPETNFEAFVFWGLFCIITGTLLYLIWQPEKVRT